ncbi:hypothetical protein BLOT_008695 [Blomia tropicalis]|nr:hypothetical protein BLOT_008695 [Blomia tropicalis]
MPSQGEIGSSSSSLPNGVSHTHLPKSIFRSLKSDRKTPGTSWSQQRHQQTQSISIYPHSMIAEQSDSKNSQRTIDPVRVYGKTTTAIRERIADLREQVRVDELALKSGNDDHIHKLKGSVGGWILTPPCTITGLGFLINLVTCSIIIAYSPDARSIVPSWSLVLCAIGVFLYQIMDALDGKQCYKVQNTQIEEFYDHGADAVSTILLMYASAIATQCGQTPTLMLTVLFASLIAFYSTHWQCYVTDQMVFGKIDVTEAQWSMIVIHLVSAIWGQSIWSTPIVFLFGHQWILSEVLSLMTLATLLNAIISNASFVLLNVKTPLDRLGVNIPRKKGLITILPAIPVILLTLIMMIAYNYGYYHVNCTMFILTFGFTYAKLTMKLVIAHCTKSDLELADPALVAPILMTLTHLAMGEPMIAPNKALLCALICNTIELIRYFTSVSWDLRLALDVDIFAVRYPPEHEKSRRHCGGFYITGLNNQEVLSRNK